MCDLSVYSITTDMWSSQGLLPYSYISGVYKDVSTSWESMEAMIACFPEQVDAITVVFSSDRRTTHLITRLQDIDVLESLPKALSPVLNSLSFYLEKSML